MKTKNKQRRRQLYVTQKKESGKSRHEERHRRRKEEAKNPELRKERLAKNQPASIDKKRVWDEVDDDSLGAVVDLAALKRRRLEQAEAAEEAAANGVVEEDDEEEDDDVDSMLGSDDEEEEDDEEKEKVRQKRAQRQSSLAPSTTSTNMDLTPDSLQRQFKYLFSEDAPLEPQILVTTSINASIHQEAQEITAVFPNSTYIRRSAHRFGHKYSIREIAKFAKSMSMNADLGLHEER